MGKPEKKAVAHQSVRFSIGAKLVTIITILVLVSLGTITVLVSYLIRQDLQVTAEYNNLEVNRRSAAEIENTMENLQSNSLVLMQIISAAGSDSALSRQAAEFFFERNRHIAALVLTIPEQADRLLVNNQFFTSKEIDASLARSYFMNSTGTLRRAAAGETLFLNASPHFDFHLLALFFPEMDGGAGAVLFSPEKVNDIFGLGANQSFLINGEGDILLHSDDALVLIQANVMNLGYIRSIRDNSSKSMQDLYAEGGVLFFAAYTKLNAGASVVITKIEYDKVFEGIAATTRRNLYLTVVVLSLSVMFIWFFSKTISVPLKTLAAAAQSIESGSFEVHLKAKGHDEIGFLTSSFEKMSAALGIFGRFTNRNIAVRAMRGEIKPGGEPKHATVFFSDIRGFTEKSEHFTKTFGSGASNRIVYWLNAYFTQMVECVEMTGGVVDKFIGDAVMAHWGTAYTSGSPHNDAFNCVKAAIMMRMALIKMNMTRVDENLKNPPIHIGCGINTGIVTAGQIGSNLRMEYTVIGDPVNLASRTEALNKPLGTDILITEDTWNLVKDFFITEEMPSVEVKGKERPVRLFAVVNFSSMPSGPRTLADLRKLLGIKAPDISKVNVNAEEKKYKIGGAK